MFQKMFTSEHTFGAYYAAEKWLKAHGYSYGSMQAGSPTAIMKNAGGLEWDIPKWRYVPNKGQLDGTIESNDFRNGPVIVNLREAPEEP